MSFVFFVTVTSTSVKVVYYVKTCILYDLYIFKIFFFGNMCFSIQGIGIIVLVYVFFFILKLEMSYVDH